MRKSPWATLAVLALAQFMVVLDVTIVNVALPDMQSDLGFSPDNLQWVISAYTLAFGGFLLLGGRLGDVLGRRAVFLVGLVLFTATSLAGGLATSQWFLVAARGVQGFGGALMSAAALSILTVTYAAGRERNIALGIWGGLAGLGGTLGVVAGGALVDAFGWEWVFFVNVPTGLALLALTPSTVADSRVPSEGPRSFDLGGAVLGTGAVLAVIYGVIRSESRGWGSGEVIGSLVAGAVLLAVFVIVEARSSAPLVPLRLFRSGSLSRSTIVLALNGGAFLAMFFLSALFLQQAKGLTAFETGLQFLPMGIAAVVGAMIATQLVPRLGTRPVQVGSAFMALVGLLLLTRATAHGSYVAELLPGFVLYGAGIMGIGVPAQISALSEIDAHDAGAASGIINTGYQVGGALGLAVISSLATAAVTSSLRGGASVTDALVVGYDRGLAVTAGIALAIVLLAAVSRQLRPSAEEVAEMAVAA